MLLSFRIRECFLEFYARIPTLMLDIFLCGVTIGVLDPDWIFMLPSGRRHRFSTHSLHTHFFMASGSVNLFLDPKNIIFLVGSLLSFYSIGSALLTAIYTYVFINTFAMCHSTRSRRRRRRVATPATTLTRRTWTWRGRRRRTIPSRPTTPTRWIRTRPSSRRGPPLLLSRVGFLAPWYATPFRLIISLLLD